MTRQLCIGIKGPCSSPVSSVVGAVQAPIAPGSCLGFTPVVHSYRDVLAVFRPLHLISSSLYSSTIFTFVHIY
ncbi:hypothetical protein RSOLAG1IB_06347 [Rhizoctonia solani AG-1 IB]|uniref:Uncharacterized protein n=1 Tax=Thanatephorus cucumeris (strain AG1-IB / isolate 7/3/14) TaxID=1108050 RepID=A0A0B7FBC1_THACB|nr:hypothetical protein RSOLAG1IB_06347 [Rhizoctonia solani AG-1 IB]